MAGDKSQIKKPHLRFCLLSLGYHREKSATSFRLPSSSSSSFTPSLLLALFFQPVFPPAFPRHWSRLISFSFSSPSSPHTANERPNGQQLTASTAATTTSNSLCLKLFSKRRTLLVYYFTPSLPLALKNHLLSSAKHHES